MTEFLHWWQHLPSKMDPVLFEIGPLKVQYYGLMYLVAFAVTYFLVVYRIKREERFDVSIEQIQNLSTAMIVGLIVGARLGYVLFYNLSYYAQHPLEIFLPFDFSNGMTLTGIAGMSYHGGLIGVIIATYIYTRRAGLSFLEIADLYVPVIPMGYTFGRLGNFINGELYGRVTDSSIGMYFPLAPGPELRHPSQLYEAFFEGIFLCIVLWSLRNIIKVRGGILGLYLIGYGTVRFIIEFYRQPDAHIGFAVSVFSVGQILCFLMIVTGMIIYWYLRVKTEKEVIITQRRKGAKFK